MPKADPSEVRAAMKLHSSGKLDDAERAFRSILSRDPDEPNCTHMLGVLYFQRQDFAAAEPLLKKSLKHADSVPEWHSNYAVFCRAIKRFDEALKHLRRAIELRPRVPESYDNLGLVLDDLDRHDEARRAYLQALAINPNYVQAHHHLASHYWNSGMSDQAILEWKHAIELQPNYADAHGSLCFALGRVGRATEAKPHGLIAVRLDPGNPDAHVSIGCALGHLGQAEEGMAHLRRALELDSNHLAALVNLGWLLELTNHHEEAAEYSRRAVEIEPTNAQALVNLGSSCTNLGDWEETVRCCRRALAAEPNHVQARSNLLLVLHSDPAISSEQLFQEHLNYEHKLAAPRARQAFDHANNRDPERPLRIGYVSSDFRVHPVARFIEPALRCHDRENFIVSCYSGVRVPDLITDTLCPLATHWHDVVELSDEELAKKINDNREDILVDLAGHTAMGRLISFALKPAPVQISYLGYVNTTGLSTMDYRITDAIADPPTITDHLYTERLLRLPCFFCYHAPQGSPEVGPLPAETNKSITFGSMNHPIKFNASVIELWAALLKRVPNSRLALMVNTPGLGAKRVGDGLQANGISPDRFTLVTRLKYLEYFAQYNNIDIALDPFPCSGHTTTCDALWMGVPVIAMAGDRYGARLSMTVLTHLGLPGLIAGNPEQYREIAAGLASDLARLGQLRASLRERMQRSIIMDAPGFTRNLENAYRTVWRAYCAKPA